MSLKAALMRGEFAFDISVFMKVKKGKGKSKEFILIFDLTNKKRAGKNPDSL